MVRLWFCENKKIGLMLVMAFAMPLAYAMEDEAKVPEAVQKGQVREGSRNGGRMRTSTHSSAGSVSVAGSGSDDGMKIPYYVVEKGGDILEESKRLLSVRKKYRHEGFEIVSASVTAGRKVRDLMSDCARRQRDKQLLQASREKGNWTKVSELLRNGAAVDCRDSDERTPLMYAYENEDEDMACILLAASADVNLYDKQERTPLMLAIPSEAVSAANAVNDLLALGAEVNVCDNTSCTPLMMAVGAERRAIFDALLQRPDINLDAQTHDGETALMIAIRMKKNERAKELIERGARLDLRNYEEERGKSAREGENGKSAIDIAGDVENYEMSLGIEYGFVKERKRSAAASCGCALL